MNSIKEKFTRGFRTNCVDINEPVKTNVSDDYPFKYYEPPIPIEELQAESARLMAEKASGKEVKPARDYTDEKVWKEMLGDHFITEEEHEKRERSRLRRRKLVRILLLLLSPILLPMIFIGILFDDFVWFVRGIAGRYKTMNEESRCSEHDKEL